MNGAASASTSAALAETKSSFTCNVCGTACVARREELDREIPSCTTCNSTVRARAIVHVLSSCLFGESLTLGEFPRRGDLTGLGLSDWEGYADRLAEKLDYRNTYYHQEPRLDIAAIPSELEESCDFLVSSDVLEHVAPPVERALVNTFRLLKPGGTLLLTVPYTLDERTTEHFPALNRYALCEFDGTKILVNLRVDGRWEVHDDLVFHGGSGETLEMRVFARDDLLAQLEQAGFRDIREWGEDYPRFGIRWAGQWSLPITARHP
jgi:SAM-dependent methyltransferase